MKYIGLKDEANVRIAQIELADVFGTYFPKTQIIDEKIYIPTINGIYRKNLANIDNSQWQLYSMEGIAVRDFIKKNDTILVAKATYSDKNILLLSVDDGKTFVDVSNTHFFERQEKATILHLSQNPHNSNVILAMHSGSGVSISYDFGLKWNLLDDFIGIFQDWFLEYNPNDTTNIFYTGEQMFFESYINASYDNGLNWKIVHSLHTHCTHGIAFHPQNKDVMLSYGEGKIAKSTDQGITWTEKTSIKLYIYKMLYDSKNPNIIYASGDFHGFNDTIEIYRSIDGGDNWHIFYQEVIENSDGVMDIQLYDNKLIIYTLINGVYYLDLDELNPSNNIRFDINPNPASSFVEIKSDIIIDKVMLYDTYGRLHEDININKEYVHIDLSELSSGIYYLSIYSSNNRYTKKIIKE